MLVASRFLTAALLCLTIAPRALAQAPQLNSAPTGSASPGVTLFRLFLTDGSSVVSYGEFTRVDDRVIFSMPLGDPQGQPRLYVVTLPGASIDWGKTDRYAASARYSWYAATRGAEDFERMSRDVALVLNEVAMAGDRRRALEIAEAARRTLAGWPATHFGYRQADVREIVAILDEAISNLRAATGVAQFDLALVSDSSPSIPNEPLLGMPSVRDQLDQVLRVAERVEHSSDRVALLHAAVLLISESKSALSSAEAKTLRRSAEARIRAENDTDAKYGEMSRKLMASASRAASRARVDDVERLLNRIPAEDARLGVKRPEAIQALRASVQAQLDDARRLRLMQDQWVIRQDLYRNYRASAGVQMLQLVKMQPSLEAIRSLKGPSPDMLRSLKGQLDGGAVSLERIGALLPADLQATHELLVGAWRFAENAVNTRSTAVVSGNVATAWEASSAAAGALLLLSRAQEEIRGLLEPPRVGTGAQRPDPKPQERVAELPKTKRPEKRAAVPTSRISR